MLAKIRGIVAVVACAALITSCGSLPGSKRLTDLQMEKATAMVVLFGASPRPGMVIGMVRGDGCQKSVYDERVKSENEAMKGLKAAAAGVDADAVINAVCRDQEIDWFSNCWGLISCAGQAFRYERR